MQAYSNATLRIPASDSDGIYNTNCNTMQFSILYELWVASTD